MGKEEDGFLQKRDHREHNGGWGEIRTVTRSQSSVGLPGTLELEQGNRAQRMLQEIVAKNLQNRF